MALCSTIYLFMNAFIKALKYLPLEVSVLMAPFGGCVHEYALRGHYYQFFVFGLTKRTHKVFLNIKLRAILNLNRSYSD